MSNDSPQSIKWQVKWKYGNQPGKTNLTAPTRQRAIDYVIWALRERGNQPIKILEAIEKKKGKA